MIPRPPGSDALSLHDAARAMGVRFAVEAVPRDAFAVANGLKLHYMDWGEAGDPAVVLLHGFAQTCRSWDFAALGLCDRFRIIALDLRGHGDTQWAPDADYSYDALLRDLHAFVETLGISTFSLMGSSLGGRTSLLYAAANPERVTSLVIVDAAPQHLASGSRNVRRFARKVDVLDSFEELVDRVGAYNYRRPLEQVRSSLVHNVKQLPDGRWTWKYDRELRSPERSYWQESGLVYRLWRAVDSVRCPTLLVRGANSNVVSADLVEEVGRRIPHCRVATVENAGHLVAGDNPAGFQAAVEPFLDDLISGSVHC